jgi:hypothetical protein
VSKKLNAAGGAALALLVAELTNGASRAVLLVLRDDLIRRIEAMDAARQAKVEGKPLVYPVAAEVQP